MRAWVKQSEVDACVKPGMTSADAARIKELEQDLRLRAMPDMVGWDPGVWGMVSK